MIKIPYGISSFEQLREGNYLYIDKTKYMALLEDDMPFQFFIRPRRFGKSLFITMLESYYDLNKKDKFDRLFGDLDIGKNPTAKKNSYLVLRLSFAGIVTNQGRDRLVQSFDYNITTRVDSFLADYSDLLHLKANEEYSKTAEGAIKFIVEKARNSDHKIFVLIDEYDNFANDLVAHGNQELYFNLLAADGYVKAFYKTLKDGTLSSIERVFMTGVSPIMLDDLTSGFNITKNLTMQPNLNEIMGITQDELVALLAKYNLEGPALLNDLKYHYNGYMFSGKATQRLYNTDMILYFLAQYLTNHEYPENMLDSNVKTDYTKLQQLALNFNDEDTLTALMNEEEVETRIVERFSSERMFADRENFISLLYYMGMLTIKGRKGHNVELRIPNYAIKTVYWDYFLNKIRAEVGIERNELEPTVKKMRLDGEIGDFLHYVQKILELLSNRDLQKFDEKYIKVLIIALLMVDGLYMIDSGYEANGYIDLLLFGDIRYREFVKYEWLIELKYLKENERSRLATVRKEAVGQLQKYANSPKVTERLGEGYKKVALTFVGKNQVYLDEV